MTEHDVYWDRATIKIVGTEIDPNEGTEQLLVALESIDDFELRVLISDVLSTEVEGYAPIPYHLDRNERVTEWGASAAIVDVVLSVPTEVIASVVTYLVTRALQREKTMLLDEGEAIEHAKFTVETRYKLSEDDLTVIQYAEENGMNRVMLADQKHEYTVTLVTTKKKQRTTATVTWKNL